MSVDEQKMSRQFWTFFWSTSCTTNQNPYNCRKTHIIGEIYSEIQEFFKERGRRWKG